MGMPPSFAGPHGIGTESGAGCETGADVGVAAPSRAGDELDAPRFARRCTAQRSARAKPVQGSLMNALPGIHRGLSRHPLPTNYQGVAIYCEWETSDSEWAYQREHFLRSGK